MSVQTFRLRLRLAAMLLSVITAPASWMIHPLSLAVIALVATRGTFLKIAKRCQAGGAIHRVLGSTWTYLAAWTCVHIVSIGISPVFARFSIKALVAASLQENCSAFVTFASGFLPLFW